MNTYTLSEGHEMNDELDIIVITTDKNTAREIAAKVAGVEPEEICHRIQRWSKASIYHELMSKTGEEGFMVVDYRFLEMDENDKPALLKFLKKHHMSFQRFNRRDEKIDNFLNNVDSI